MIHIKKKEELISMEIKKRISSSNTPYFFSNEMIITKKSLSKDKKTTLNYSNQEQVSYKENNYKNLFE